jgi:hypothetical protein
MIMTFYIKAKRQAEARLDAEWKEMVTAIDRYCVLQEREIMRKQR